ncbi:hypothetical protein GCM10010353_62920 [Streptomyces chryseus]|nr:hypothetical protein GCM10010353_62920 [Streptomyces chryseus]
MRNHGAARTPPTTHGHSLPRLEHGGREETQQLHLNPRSERWLPDHSRLQHHVGSAIAYNVWQYCEASGDTEFLHTKGAEMLTEIARFWAHLATYDESTGRYRILGVVGPDEYHDAWPGSSAPGLDDNAYTNVSAAWVLARPLDVVRSLPGLLQDELRERTGLQESELDRWDEVSRKLRVAFHDGVVSQFEGYGALAELDWSAYRARYGDIRRLDRILEAEGDTVNRYQASKQADVLMLGYLFSPSELRQVFARLGYERDDPMWARTVDYYLRRTSHGSTLSGLVHGWVLARARREDAWTYVEEVLAGDVADVQGGATEEGNHLGAMAGTLDLVQRGLTGLETRDGVLWLDPVPLQQLSEYGFSARYQGHVGGRRAGAGQRTPYQHSCLRKIADRREASQPYGVPRRGQVLLVAAARPVMYALDRRRPRHSGPVGDSQGPTALPVRSHGPEQ